MRATPTTDETVSRVVVGVVVPEGDGCPPGLESLAGEVELRLATTADELARRCADAAVLFVWEFNHDLVRSAWPHLQQLQWVHAASAGVDAVVFPELLERDVAVTNTKGVLDGAIAEWVLGVLLLFTKDLHTTLALQRERRWRHRESERLAGRRVLVVGAGSIGRAIARLCRAAGLEVEGIARRPRAEDPDFERVGTSSALLDRLPHADFVVISAPLTADTRGMIGAGELAAMSPGARLVNVGRGPVVDEGALVEALRRRRIAGAALDVFDDEPLPPAHPLWSMDQVIVSPHMSGDFAGWREAFSAVFVDHFGRWRRGEPLPNVVDVAAATRQGTS